MRHALLALTLATSALSLVACTEPSSGAGGSNAAAAPAKRDHRKLVADGASLVDVRTTDEFGDGHVQGAKNIPVDQIGARMAEIPKDKPVVVYCASGARSAAAARTLKNAGYDAIDIGGMRNW